MTMTTATKITFVRVLLIPVFLVCMYVSESVDWMCYIALAVFAIASLTDFVDGEVARRCNQVSNLGKFLDPLADKVLVIAAMAMLCELGQFPAWALMIVLTREFAVSGLRMIAATKGTVIAAGWSGKVKTATTMVCLCLALLLRGVFFTELLGEGASMVVEWVNVALISGTTLYSGVEYFVKNAAALKD
mgnify:FL=1